VTDSTIPNGGSGLFAGPLGFRKDEIIGEYSKDWMKVKQGKLDCRNGKNARGECNTVNTSYVLCDERRKNQKESEVQCWDGLDKNSTIIRNSNDAHGSKYHNNANFEKRKDTDGKTHIYMVASRRIGGMKEILTQYGSKYW
jgi:hypothetical protein